MGKVTVILSGDRPFRVYALISAMAGKDRGAHRVRSAGIEPVLTALASISRARPAIGGDDNRGAQLSASYPFLASLRNSVAAHKWSVEPSLACRFGQGGESFPCAHCHGIVLTDNGPNLKLTRRAQRQP